VADGRPSHPRALKPVPQRGTSSAVPSNPNSRLGRKASPIAQDAARSDEFPDVPTIGDFVPGYEAGAWYGIGAPKGTSADIVEKLNKETNAALADPKIKTRLADFGGTVLTGSSANFGKLIAEETEKWAKVVKFSGAKPD
jgi:tripartite-type tricarboxylate transporter receptor subunit TctC